MCLYDTLEDFLRQHAGDRLWLLSTKAPRAYTEAEFRDGDYLLFGPESKGLPEDLLERRRDSCLKLPMLPEARSLNLSNSVAVTVYEALRQMDFPGMKTYGKMHTNL